MRLVDALERAEIKWCAIDGVAVNHWAIEPMVTQDVDFAVTSGDIERTIEVLRQTGFSFERFEWSVNFKGTSKVSIQLSTENTYLDYPERGVPADVHGILLRVASLEDTLHGKILAWRDRSRRQSKRAKDFADIARLVESHPILWNTLPKELQDLVERPV